MAQTTAYLLMHEGIRVELNRLAGAAEELAAGRAHAGPRQVAALRAHVDDFLDAIHHHHVGEDDHLWPLLRSVGVGHDALDPLSADHGQLDGLMLRVRTAAAALADGSRGRSEAAADLADASGTLRDLMDRHLDEEESIVVPAITDKVADDELRQMEKRMQRASKVKMSFVLPWLAEADPTRMATVAADLGPVFPLLLAVTRGRYRRRVAVAYGAASSSLGR